MRLYTAGLLLAAAIFSTLFSLLFPHTGYLLPWLISGFLLFSSILFLSGSILPVLPVKHPAFEILVKNEKLLLLLIKSNGKKVSYISPQALPYFSQYRNDWLGGFCTTEKDSLKQDFAHAAAGKNPDQGEYRLKTETGKELWLSIRMYGIRRWNCTRLVAVVCRDVSVSRESQLQLVEAREYEIEVGARIQQSLLLGKPVSHSSSIEVGSFTLPSQKIDGDFMDFYSFPESGYTDFVLGDVMGKGVPAALMGAAARTEIMRAHYFPGRESEGKLPAPEEILGTAEANLAQELQKLHSFVTLVYGRLYASGKLLQFIDCGHTSIIHYDSAEGSCWRIKGSNMPLGFVDRQTFKPYMTDLSPGDVLFTYSDGITEASNSEGELFGEERLMLLIRASSDLSTADLLEKVKRITFSYCAGNFRDDVTCIAVKIAPEQNVIEAKTRQKTFPQQLDAIRAIREFVEESLAGLLPPDSGSADLRNEIGIAAAEAGTNILRHQKPADNELKVCIRRGESWISLKIEYDGQEYNWQDITPPDPARYQQGGYGQFLMNSIMDSVLLEQGEHERQRLVMLKRIPEKRL